MTAELEVVRVARHIERAEALAAERDLSGLTHLQRMIRQLLLRVLAEYRGAGRFPQNRDFADQRPYFVDADGTRCAMAHLLEHGGEHALVAKIARERNNAYVRELADESRLLAWLAAAGLTVEEAAAIQPGYCSTNSSCICGGEDFNPIDYPVPALGVLEAVVQANGMALVQRTYGDSLGIEVGSFVELGGFDTKPAGSRVLIPIDSASTAPYGSVLIADDGNYHCRSQGVDGSAPPISLDELQQVLRSSDCPAALADIDEQWGGDSCNGQEEQGLPVPGDGDGACNGSGSESMSVGILLALVTVLVRRR